MALQPGTLRIRTNWYHDLTFQATKKLSVADKILVWLEAEKTAGKEPVIHDVMEYRGDLVWIGLHRKEWPAILLPYAETPNPQPLIFESARHRLKVSFTDRPLKPWPVVFEGIKLDGDS